ncbi:MAG: Uma2 family endonuclease [Chloroflexi bacterium]|nr:Uma2 family endonuclease [Chloroflexota bacterium]
MSATKVKHVTVLPTATVEEPPPLQSGDQLTRAEFARRYHAHPELKKAELIEGVVHVPSPTRHITHGQPHARMIAWLGQYWAANPILDMSDNATLRLDYENELQPDILLRLPVSSGGTSWVNESGYLEGPPELVVEIAASSAAYDMHAKKRVYSRSGVKEYLVAQMYEERIDWFVLDEGVFMPIELDEQGILRSQVFPGLWLNVQAFWEGGLAAMLDVLKVGIDSPEHQAFIEYLEGQRNR